MNEHLPECWSKDESDPLAWCICDELRACEQRLLDAAQEAVSNTPMRMGAFDTRAADVAAINALRE